MTPTARDRLDRFASLLQRWNATLNLVAPGDMPHLWDRHIEDSLQLAPLIPAGTERAVDLGSGGGFPGLVLAIATGLPFDLIEADRRKAAFLRTAVLETGAPAHVHASRIEAAVVPAAPLVTARALAPLPRLLPMVAKFLAADGVCLLLKGAKAEDELAVARKDWRMCVETSPSRTHPDGAILRITRLEPRAK
jgi:16S rRNA (guanine527-N7)-methyltransferase